MGTPLHRIFSATQNRDTTQFFGRVEDIFAVSKCLAPPRSDDHIILFTPGSGPKVIQYVRK